MRGSRIGTQLQYWTDHTINNGPTWIPQEGHTYMLSIILEAEAQRNFKGIRVVIVRKDTLWTEMAMTIEDRLEPCVKASGPSGLRRNGLVGLRGSNQLNMAAQLDRTGWKDEICTIVFELSMIQTSNGVFSSILHLTRYYPPIPQRVLYDRTERTRPSLLLFLECSHPILTYRGTTEQIHTNLFAPPLVDRAHFIRVLPVRRSRSSSFATFPLPILRHVILYIMDPRMKDWRRNLLSCGMVCKAWSPVLDLFFKHLFSASTDLVWFDLNVYLPEIGAVARSLRANPLRGLLVKKYSPTLFHQAVEITEQVFWNFCSAQNTILQLARNVKDITIEFTHTSLVQDLLDTLSSLREVRSFHVARSYRFRDDYVVPKTFHRLLTFEEVQKSIAEWPHPTKLKLSKWTAHSKSYPRAPVKGVPSEARCPTEELTLGNGRLTRSQLLFLAGPSTSPPNLRVLQLGSVGGINNADFRAFLTRTAPTIVQLAVWECSFPKAPGDEYAIDATISDMTSLESLRIHGNVATALSISRKAHRRNVNHGELRITNPSPMNVRTVVEALLVSGWKSISIELEIDQMVSYSPELRPAVGRIASSRGIDFRVNSTPSFDW